MAQTATRRASAARKRHAAPAAHATRREPASKLADKIGDGRSRFPDLGELSLPRPHLPKPRLSIWAKLVAAVLKKVAKHELKRLSQVRNWSLEPVITDELKPITDELQHRLGVGNLRPRLPIQEAVDVAVPIAFAWSEWMTLRFLPEGVDLVVDIERDGGGLTGRLDGDSDEPWSAEVLDERERESFAWQSAEGSDCAGLVTFHSLSERLTRLELTLDVLPRDAAQSALLLTHVADRRARSDLRRFKADLEAVSPDVYASGESTSSR